MRARLVVPVCMLFLVAVALPAGAGTPDDDTQTRGLFIGSRPKTRMPVAQTKRASTFAGSATARAKVPTTPDEAKTPVGIGFSVFQVVSRSRSVRVDPSATFRTGDALRFVIEPSIDGYLYLFASTGDGKPVMIYPDYRLNEGDNFVYAHTLTEVPSRRNTKFDVFIMAGEPATERMFIVVSRDPLQGVPVANELVAYCETKAGPCPWSPAGTVWEPLAKQSTATCLTSARIEAKKAISAIEEEALTREIILGSSDDQPSVIAVNESADAPLLVRTVNLRHE